ncbi:hypothetical protein GC197_10050 [bacterium]|nr:hypothetical protein [bacterium]
MSIQRSILTLAVSLASIFAILDTAMAQDQAAISKTRRFLETTTNARYVISFAHFGADFKQMDYLGTVDVKDRYGNKIPGEFALVYYYTWDAYGAGHTKIAYLCDKNGNIEDVQVLSCDANVQRPFAMANVSIKLIGQIVIEAFREQMKPDELRKAQALVQAADSEGLLEMGIGFRQQLNIR